MKTSTKRVSAPEVKEPRINSKILSTVRIEIILLIAIVLLLVWNYFFIYHTIMNLEYARVWGKENYDIVNTIQKKQIEQTVQYYKSNPDLFGTPSGTQASPENEAPTGSTSINSDVVAQLKNNAALLGDAQAPISWIEFSDLECPYCKQMKESGVYENMTSKYPGKINYMFKHFPLNIHPGSAKKHELLECMREQQGDEAYFALKDSIFDKNGYNAPTTLESSKDLAVELWADAVLLETCLSEGTQEQKILSSIADAQNYFQISGTPTTVLLNNATGEYKVISGAASESSFDSALTLLLAK